MYDYAFIFRFWLGLDFFQKMRSRFLVPDAG